MVTRFTSWLVPVALLGTAAYAVAEEITLTTYYPSPRGVYAELRTSGNVQIGSIDPPADPATAPRLHIQQTDSLSTAPLLQVESTRLGSTPVVIDKDGNVGIGTTPHANTKLDVSGSVQLFDQVATSGISTLTVRAGAMQGAAPLLQWQNNAGTVLGMIDSAGNFKFGAAGAAGGPKLYFVSGNNPTCNGTDLRTAVKIATNVSYTVKWGWPGAANYGSVTCQSPSSAWVAQPIYCGHGGGANVIANCQAYCNGTIGYSSYDGALGPNGTVPWNVAYCLGD